MYIGIDIGGTNLKAGLVDDSGHILEVCRVPLGVYKGAEPFAATLAHLAQETARKGGVDPQRVSCVGMGFPGAVKDGKIIYTCNIPIEDVSIEQLFRKHLDVPVLLGNDADCAGVGEFLCGAGRGTKDFVVVTLGTGVGGGLILNQRLYTGMGMGGEIGHMVVAHDGIQCNCGRRGCWETYASATGLIRMTKAAMEAAPDSALHTVAAENGAVDGRTAFAAAARGDAQGIAVCETYVSYLADGIANVINMLHPEKIALGGGIAGAPDELLLKPLQKQVASISYPRHGGRMTEIVKAELGNDAGIIGAALLGKVI